MFGRVPSGAAKGDVFPPAPIPDRMRVTWSVVADSSRGRADVDVLRRAGSKFSGDVRLVIRSNGNAELRLEPLRLDKED